MKTLKGMTWEHERGFGSVSNASSVYEQLNPDISIEWTFRSLQAFADQSLRELAEVFDLMVIDHPHIPHAAEEGILACLDGRGHDQELEVLAKQSVGKSHVSYSHIGHQWGLATDAAAQVSAFRPDLLLEAPKNWDEVFALARQGKVVWPYKPVDAWSSLITVASGLGEPPMQGQEHFLSRETLRESMEVLRELARLVPENNQFWNPIDAAEELASDSEYSYCPLLFGYTNYSRRGFRANRISYRDIPNSREGLSGSLLGGAGITVSAFGKYTQEAIDFAFWLASAEVQESHYFIGGGQPGNSVAWESERTNEETLDFFRNTRATLEHAYLRPRNAKYIELQNELSVLVTAYLVDEFEFKQLAELLDQGVRKWL